MVDQGENLGFIFGHVAEATAYNCYLRHKIKDTTISMSDGMDDTEDIPDMDEFDPSEFDADDRIRPQHDALIQ